MKKHSFKKVLALLIAIIMVIPAIPVVASAATTTATPTDTTYVDDLGAWLEAAKDPSDETGKTFLINDKDDLIYFMMIGQLSTASVTLPDGSTVETRLTGYTIKLTDDIVFNDGEVVDGAFVPAASQNGTVYTWSPYKTKSTGEYYGFRGIFDGQGHTISGIVIASTAANTGFFGHTGRGVVVRNVNFENMFVSVTGTNLTYHGAVIGLADSTLLTQVYNVDVDCTIAASGQRYVGGVIGSINADGELNMDNVSVNCDVTGAIGVGGLLGRTKADGAGTLTITNCFVSGNITAGTMVAGGYIGATGTSAAVISDSVCYANVTSNSTNTDVRASAGGFIGIAEGNTTMTNCQFLGAVTGPQAAWTTALATVADITAASYPNINPTTPDAHYTATFTDCYFASGSAKQALGVYHRSNGTANNWYDVTVDYTNDDIDAVTIDLTTLYGEGEGQATGQAAQSALLSANIKTYYISSATGTDSAILGAQMGTNSNARIVATVAGDKNITDIEFATVTLDKYMKTVNTSGNLGWKSWSASEKTHCGYAYKSLKDNFGLGTIEAEGENEYLVALAICGVNADKATTVLVRTAYYTPSVDADTGEVKSVRSYGQYMAVTFYNGEILGLAYVG